MCGSTLVGGLGGLVGSALLVLANKIARLPWRVSLYYSILSLLPSRPVMTCFDVFPDIPVYVQAGAVIPLEYPQDRKSIIGGSKV